MRWRTAVVGEAAAVYVRTAVARATALPEIQEA